MKTIQEYIMAVKNGETEGAPDVLARAYKLLGNVYYLFEDTSEAEKHYLTSVKYAEQLPDKTDLLKLYHNLALVNTLKGDRQKARYYADKMLSIEVMQEGMQAYFHTMASGVIERRFGNVNTSLAILQKAANLAETHRLPAYLKTSPMIEMATIYEEDHRYQEALSMLAKIEKEIGNSADNPKFAISVMRSYMNIYIELGDTEKASKYQQSYLALSDSVMNQSRFLKARSAFHQREAQTDMIKLNSRQYAMSDSEIILLIAGVLLLAAIIVLLLRRRAPRRESATPMQPAETPEESIPAPTQNASPDFSALFSRIEEIVSQKEFYTDSHASLEMLAARLEVNVKYVSQAINIEGGVNFRTYLNRFRIAEARRVIDASPAEAVIADISVSVGFLSQSAFIASFKKFVGMTPSMYLKERRRGADGEPRQCQRMMRAVSLESDAI